MRTAKDYVIEVGVRSCGRTGRTVVDVQSCTSRGEHTARARGGEGGTEAEAPQRASRTVAWDRAHAYTSSFFDHFPSLALLTTTASTTSSS